MTEVSLRWSVVFFAGAGPALRWRGVPAAAADSRRCLASGLPSRTMAIPASAISSTAATALTAIVARRQGRMRSRSCTCSIARSEFVPGGSAPATPLGPGVACPRHDLLDHGGLGVGVVLYVLPVPLRELSLRPFVV